MEKPGANSPVSIDISQIPEVFIDRAREFQRVIMMYSCAIREVKTKLEVLNDDLSLSRQRNPIELIKSRVKSPASIVEKLQRRGYPVTMESMMDHLTDVAGVRVICPFVDDIYTVANMLTRQDDVRVMAVKDYIIHPKPNGYRSYHIIVEIPVFFSDEVRRLPVEVQIRTMAMDFWASLDHQLKYKKDMDINNAHITNELRECAELIARTDERMLEIRRNIEDQRDNESFTTGR